MYRVGFPFWKTLAKMGVPILVRVHVHNDPDTKTYWADSPDLDGLTVAGHTLDEVRREVVLAADSLLELALKSNKAKAQTEIRIRDAALCVA